MSFYFFCINSYNIRAVVFTQLLLRISKHLGLPCNGTLSLCLDVFPCEDLLFDNGHLREHSMIRLYQGVLGGQYSIINECNMVQWGLLMKNQ